MTYDFTLHRGAGHTAEKACLMQRAALIHAERHGYLHELPIDKVLTDHPCWANESLTAIGIRCNDAADDEERQRLRPMLERILRAERRTPEVERRINARILCAQARRVLHLVRPEDREVCERAVATREAWLAGEATEDDCQKAAWAAGAAGAAGAARVAWVAWAAGAAGAAGAARAARAAEAAGAARVAGEFDPVAWLDQALDDHAKAIAEEGAVLGDGEAGRLVAEFVQAAGS